jgi:hypothetical protein
VGRPSDRRGEQARQWRGSGSGSGQGSGIRRWHSAQVSCCAVGIRTEPRERLLIRAVDTLYRNGRIDDTLWLALRGTLSKVAILHIVMLCGWHAAMSTCTRTMPQTSSSPKRSRFRPENWTGAARKRHDQPE